MTTSWRSLVDLLIARAAAQPDHRAFTFLDNGEDEGAALTWAELDRQSRAIAAAIRERAPRGARVLVMCAPGLDFVPAFFGCAYAGVIAIPTYPPSGSRADRAAERLRGMVQDAGATLGLTTAATAARLAASAAMDPRLASLPWLAIGEVHADQASEWRHPETTAEDVAFLQYTSGSTAVPRGVMVGHGNLLHNLAASAALAGHDRDSVAVSWLPVNHDMGLIDGVLQPVFSGFPAWLMAPAAFLQRPVRWLQAISRLRATHSGGPNFAYDLAVRRVGAGDRAALDLSGWRIAYNGSEPVRAETLAAFHRTFGECGFRWNAFRPAYGLAESTLLVTSGRLGADAARLTVDPASLARGQVVTARAGTRLVGSGRPAPGTTVVIVNPETHVRCEPDRVGEIWVAGPSVAAGYWGQAERSAAAFGARLDTGEGPFLRTGDLGFLRSGELYVTGRIKDVLIVRGLKHYPQDLERTAERAAGRVRPGCCAAFAIDCDGEERAAIVAEIDTTAAAPNAEDLHGVVADIRRAVAEGHQLALCAVTLVEAGSLAKTTSGKLQRYRCRESFLAGSLRAIAMWRDPGHAGATDLARMAS
jgi:acyl-CoA synthetase (AMP-forming)/AMP-acid ligase II